MAFTRRSGAITQGTSGSLSVASSAVTVVEGDLIVACAGTGQASSSAVMALPTGFTTATDRWASFSDEGAMGYKVAVAADTTRDFDFTTHTTQSSVSITVYSSSGPGDPALAGIAHNGTNLDMVYRTSDTTPVSEGFPGFENNLVHAFISGDTTAGFGAVTSGYTKVEDGVQSSIGCASFYDVDGGGGIGDTIEFNGTAGSNNTVNGVMVFTDEHQIDFDAIGTEQGGQARPGTKSIWRLSNDVLVAALVEIDGDDLELFYSVDDGTTWTFLDQYLGVDTDASPGMFSFFADLNDVLWFSVYKLEPSLQLRRGVFSDVSFTEDFTGPTLVDSNETQVSSATSISLTKPDNLEAGNLLVAIVNKAEIADWTAGGTGWTEQTTLGAGGQRFSLVWKIATKDDARRFVSIPLTGTGRVKTDNASWMSDLPQQARETFDIRAEFSHDPWSDDNNVLLAQEGGAGQRSWYMRYGENSGSLQGQVICSADGTNTAMSFVSAYGISVTTGDRVQLRCVVQPTYWIAGKAQCEFYYKKNSDDDLNIDSGWTSLGADNNDGDFVINDSSTAEMSIGRTESGTGQVDDLNKIYQVLFRPSGGYQKEHWVDFRGNGWSTSITDNQGTTWDVVSSAAAGSDTPTYDWGWTTSGDASGVIAAFDTYGITPTFGSVTTNTLRTDDTTPASASGSPTAGTLLLGSSSTVDGTSGLGMATSGLALLGDPTTGTSANDIASLLAWKIAAGTESVFEVNNAGASADSYVHYWWFNLPWDGDNWNTAGTTGGIADIQSNAGRLKAPDGGDNYNAESTAAATRNQELFFSCDPQSQVAERQFIIAMLRASPADWYTAGGQPDYCYKLLVRTDSDTNGSSLDRRINTTEVSLVGGDDNPQANSRTGYGKFWVRAQVEDVGDDTVIRYRIWDDGSSEPTDWDEEYTDTTSGALWNKPGGFGFRTYGASEGTNPTDNRIDNVEYTELPGTIAWNDDYEMFTIDENGNAMSVGSGDVITDLTVFDVDGTTHIATAISTDIGDWSYCLIKQKGHEATPTYDTEHYFEIVQRDKLFDLGGTAAPNSVYITHNHTGDGRTVLDDAPHLYISAMIPDSSGTEDLKGAMIRHTSNPNTWTRDWVGDLLSGTGLPQSGAYQQLHDSWWNGRDYMVIVEKTTAATNGIFVVSRDNEWDGELKDWVPPTGIIEPAESDWYRGFNDSDGNLYILYEQRTTSPYSNQIWRRTVDYGFTHVDDNEATATGSTSISLTKPTGLAVGDLMVALVINYNDNYSFTKPTGWTTYDTRQGSNMCYNLDWKIADSSDVAASQFTWSTIDSNDKAGVIAAFSGDSGDITATPMHVTTQTLRSNDTSPISATFVSNENTLLLAYSATTSGTDTGGLDMVTTGYTLSGNPSTGAGSSDVGVLLAWKVADGTETSFEVDNAVALSDSFVQMATFDVDSGQWDDTAQSLSYSTSSTGNRIFDVSQFTKDGNVLRAVGRHPSDSTAWAHLHYQFEEDIVTALGGWGFVII